MKTKSDILIDSRLQANRTRPVQAIKNPLAIKVPRESWEDYIVRKGIKKKDRFTYHEPIAGGCCLCLSSDEPLGSICRFNISTRGYLRCSQ